MNIRTDFVTNSSSTSFVLGRKGELSDRARQAIAAYVERRMLGTAVLKPGATEKEIEAIAEKYDFHHVDDVRKALAAGKTIFAEDMVSEISYSISEIFRDVWEILEREEGEFEIIEEGLPL